VLCFLKKIKAKVATKNSGITINIENSGIEGVEFGVGVNVVDVAWVSTGVEVAEVDGAGVDGFAVGFADVDGVGVGVGLIDGEIRFW